MNRVRQKGIRVKRRRSRMKKNKNKINNMNECGNLMQKHKSTSSIFHIKKRNIRLAITFAAVTFA